MQVHHVHHSSRARGTVLFLQTIMSVTRNMNVKVAIELYYIFQNFEIKMQVTFHLRWVYITIL